MDRIDRIKVRQKAARMNGKQLAFYSSFIIPPSSFLLHPVYPVHPC
jgi:hypothetical protein